MTKKIILCYLICCLFHNLAFSQAGKGVYQFLDLPVSSRIAAMGGTNVSLKDNDINFSFCNPSLLTDKTNNFLSLSMANYLSDIQYGSAVFGKNFKNKHYMAFGVQYVDYGTFQEATEENQIIGEFTAKDMALYVMYAYPLTEKISVGGTFKPIYSAYERYSSFGVAIDAGVSYNDPTSFFSAGLVLRNIGSQIKGYYSDEEGQHYEPLPFNIQLGVTKKLAYAPLRFTGTFHNLQHWDLSYASSTSSSQDETKDIGFFDMALRHFIFNAEFIPSNNFYLTLGYNFRRAKEMKVEDFKSQAGLSFGGGIKLYKFHVGFGMSTYQVGNSVYQFSLGTSLSEFGL
ncbi:MAG: type IX secretion system protein PorQ [Paludibacteraceae bacterium]|nr:type IX secretion system protein PorQ [Paludibacteraceae bacterium]HNZ62191.1 type IX secretion system protein PorQ [Paludibacteraceae bacterium]